MRYLLFLLSIAFVSCGESTDQTQTDSIPAQPEIVITTGVVTQLSCKMDVTNTYEVYLPTSLSDTAVYPVVVFFSPQGDGKVPVEKYKAIAEEWEFILVGSNYTRNGMDANLALNGANTLVNDVLSRFNVDPARLYLSGFSGGARIAGGLALQRMDVTGVICCSAAPPESVAPRGYVGIAGLGDMNYLEMKKFQATQTGASLSELLVFDGKHEWPSPIMMENAMLMISLYQPGTAQSGDMNQMSDSLTANVLRQSDSLSQISCMLESNLLASAERAEKNYSGSGAILDRRKKVSTSCVKSDEQKWKEVESKESDLQAVLQESILSHDTTWWRGNADSYFETDKTGPEKFMRQRLRGYTSLLCYTYCGQAFSMNNVHAAEKLVKVYSIVDPENSEWAYLQSGLYMRLNMTSEAIMSMSKAVELGFHDRKRVEKDPVFSPVMSDPAFQQVLSGM
jgi:pimeloyl-ACP methyl ester carboxylesterase